VLKKPETPQPTRRASYRGPNRFRTVETRRLIKGVQDAGLSVAGVEVDPRGVIRVLTGQPGASDISKANPWDEVLKNAADQKRPA
jgi:hypothetical protein